MYYFLSSGICGSQVQYQAPADSSYSSEPVPLYRLSVSAAERVNGLWVCWSAHLQSIETTSPSALVADMTCSLFIHQFKWMNDMAVWVEPHTAALLLKFDNDSRGRKRNLCPLSREKSWGEGDCCIVIWSTLNTSVMCNALLKINLAFRYMPLCSGNVLISNIRPHI